jgi:hypothetical protein
MSDLLRALPGLADVKHMKGSGPAPSHEVPKPRLQGLPGMEIFSWQGWALSESGTQSSGSTAVQGLSDNMPPKPVDSCLPSVSFRRLSGDSPGWVPSAATTCSAPLHHGHLAPHLVQHLALAIAHLVEERLVRRAMLHGVAATLEIALLLGGETPTLSSIWLSP